MNEADLLIVVGASVTVDVGNHACSLGRYLESGGQPVLMSGYLGSIGFGYPAALGAWAAAPDAERFLAGGTNPQDTSADAVRERG